MRGIKKLAMRPYHGSMWVADSTEAFGRAYKCLTRKAWPHEPVSELGGQYVMLDADVIGNRVYLIYANGAPALAHEITHCLLLAFRTIGHDPREGDGEPFCYMLSQLMEEASEK